MRIWAVIEKFYQNHQVFQSEVTTFHIKIKRWKAA